MKAANSSSVAKSRAANLTLYGDARIVNSYVQDPYHIVRRALAVKLFEQALNDLESTEPILEIGGAQDSMLHGFAAKDRVIINADIANDLSKKHDKNGHLTMHLDATGPLPFKDSSIAAIITGEFIEHPFNIKEVLEEFWRVLVPGGILVVTTPNLAALQDRVRFMFGNSPRHVDALHPYLSVHIRPFAAKSLEKILNATGFEQLALQSNFVGWELPSGKWLQSRRLAQWFPALGGSLIISARKRNQNNNDV